MRVLTFTEADGTEWSVPQPDRLEAPVRRLDTSYPLWVADVSSDVVLIRKPGDEEDSYSLTDNGDGTFTFRDVDIDTVMYVMTPSDDGGYTLEWDQYTTEDRPETCGEGELALPDGDESLWSAFLLDRDSLAVPVYDADGELSRLFDVRLRPTEAGLSYVWDLESEEAVIWMQFGGGYRDTRGRRIYDVVSDATGPAGSLLFSDGVCLCYDGAGNLRGRLAGGDDGGDEGGDDVGGLEHYEALALEAHMAAFDDAVRARSDELRREIWTGSFESAESPLESMLRALKMWADSDNESMHPTCPVGLPVNYSRRLGSYTVEAGRDAVSVRDSDGNVVKTAVSEDGNTWTVLGSDGVQERVFAPDGQGSYSDGTSTLVPSADIADYDLMDDYGECSETNRYLPFDVVGPDGEVIVTAWTPERMADPWDEVTYAEFVDAIPLYREGNEWFSHAGKAQWTNSLSENVHYEWDVTSRFGKLSYRVRRDDEWDRADKVLEDADGNEIDTQSLDDGMVGMDGSLVAKLYPSPEVTGVYQVFDNLKAEFDTATSYANGCVVVVNPKGNVVCYILADGRYMSPVWIQFGTVSLADRAVYDTNGDVLYTLSEAGGDINVTDANGELRAHAYVSTEANDQWIIASGCQRLFTFLSSRSTVIVNSDGAYTYRTLDGSDVRYGVVSPQANSSGEVCLSIADETGAEIYRVTPSGGVYQCDAANGVAFDTVKADSVSSIGNMVLTRYYSVPYGRTLYSCTGDQVEGSFDGSSSVSEGAGDTGGDGVVPLGADIRGNDSGVHTVSGGLALYADSGSASASASTGTSSSSGETSSISDIIETVSNYYDDVAGILTKDKTSSEGEDLNEDEPLQVAHMETDGRLIANAAFTNEDQLCPWEAIMLSDAYDYTQAVTRLSKAYSEGRSDYYKAAQEATETRTTRLEYKKAAFTATMSQSVDS